VAVITARGTATFLGGTHASQKCRGPSVKIQLQLACEELRASVAEAPVGVGVGYDGDDDIIRFDTAALQLLTEICIKGCLLRLRSFSACDPDEDNLFGAIDTEPGVLDNEVRFGVLLIHLVAIP
jgi:hypothetical protein